jgi:hypothetical protein
MESVSRGPHDRPNSPQANVSIIDGRSADLEALAGNELWRSTGWLHCSACLDLPSRFRKSGGDQSLVGESGPILGGKDFVRKSFERVADDRILFRGAEDQTNRWVLAGDHPVLSGIVEVQVHLARISVGEVTELQVDDDKAPKAAVKEYQIDTVPLGADP